MKTSSSLSLISRPWFWLGLLFLTTLAVYLQVLQFDFVRFDDGVYVTENPFVKQGLTLENILWVFTHFYDSNWFPLTWMSHMLSYQIFGMNAGGHHFINVVFHLLNTYFLFKLFLCLGGNWRRALAVAGIFALHPLHVESVAWVAERKDVLSGFFFMLTLLAYVEYTNAKSRHGVRYLRVLILFALGLMCKSMLVTLPLVLLLLDYWPLRRMDKISFRRLFFEKLPLLSLSLMASVAAFLAQHLGNAIPDLEKLPLDIRLQNSILNYAKYLKKYIFPFDLAVYYPYSPDNLFVGKVIAAVFTVMMITLIVFQHGRKHRYLVTGWLWYLGMLVPVSGIIQAGGQALADRYTYLPLIGITMIVVWGIPQLLRRWKYSGPVLRTSAVVGLIILAFICSNQAAYWRNTGTLFSQAVRVTKRNVMAHTNLGEYYTLQGRYQEAAYHYEQASTIQNRPELLNNLGNTYFSLGRIDDAMRVYAEAIQKDPKQVMAFANLGIMLAEKKRFKEAESFYAHALDIDPSYEAAYTAWAETLLRQGYFYQSGLKLRAVLDLNAQNAVAYYFLGILHLQTNDFETVEPLDAALSRRDTADYTLPDKEIESMFFYEGDTDAAFRYFEKALSLNPKFYLASIQWGIALARLGRYDEAVQRFQDVFSYQPYNGLAHSHLGRTFFLMGQYQSAMEHYQMALQTGLDRPRVHKRLGDLLVITGNLKDAITHYEEALYYLPDYEAAGAALKKLQESPDVQESK